ncbi:MAG TPA: hypothetical protein VLV78_13500 [Thermoanaerobaculia bacterium]|nr:hypothetical protein [Thermoanaerobaculia bacterium]
MDDELRSRLESFLKPLFQDLDGVSRVEDVERIARIARVIHGRDDRDLELLLLFHALARWLDKVGNLSRTLLAVPGLSEEELRRAAASIRRLDTPSTDVERSVAAAILIDRSGVHGLAQRFAAGRREGHTVLDVVREALADSWVPEWVPVKARPLLEERLESRRNVCAALLEELGVRGSGLAARTPYQGTSSS